MTTRPQLTRREVLALPPTIDLPTLARALGVGEWGIRERARHGELGSLGIRCLRIGVQYRVPTADVWRVLGVSPNGEGGPDPPDPPDDQTAAEPLAKGYDIDHGTRDSRRRA